MIDTSPQALGFWVAVISSITASVVTILKVWKGERTVTEAKGIVAATAAKTEEIHKQTEGIQQQASDIKSQTDGQMGKLVSLIETLVSRDESRDKTLASIITMLANPSARQARSTDPKPPSD